MTKIHSAILDAMRLIAKSGIAKLSRNKDQGYNFRGIEAAMNEMSPILINCGISVCASYSDLSFTERESKSGGKLRFAVVKGSFRFEAEDGSFVTFDAYGEGMDSSDKATAKAMAVAFRTALFQQFVVPTMAIDPDTGYGAPSRQDELRELADGMVEKFEAGNVWGAFEDYATLEDNDEKLLVWTALKPHSKLRAAIKELGDVERKRAEELAKANKEAA